MGTNGGWYMKNYMLISEGHLINICSAPGQTVYTRTSWEQGLECVGECQVESVKIHVLADVHREGVLSD